MTSMLYPTVFAELTMSKP